MKAIMISIKPKWVAKILNGEKTIEIRKTCPSIFKHLKSYEGASLDVYIYCTKSNYFGYISKRYIGKVVAKFTLNKVEEIIKAKTLGVPMCYTQSLLEKDLCMKSCLTPYDFNDYLDGKTGYAWHISNLVIFDKPKELSEFYKVGHYEDLNDCFTDEKQINGKWCIPLKKAPQSWCYVEVE